MNDRRLEESWWLLSRTRGVGLVLRVVILASPLAAMGSMRFAADHTLPIINIPVVALTLLCVVLPDSHIGLLVVLLVGTEWLVTVHEPATPWSIVVACSLAAFHTSMAAATVAPPAARWTRAMCRRWSRRTLTVMVASAGNWAAVAAIDRYEVASSAVLVTTSLVIIAIGAMWARNGTVAATEGQGKPG